MYVVKFSRIVEFSTIGKLNAAARVEFNAYLLLRGFLKESSKFQLTMSLAED